jgi:hypothetical protein
MRELTQTVTGLSGNCWQTCVACLLDIDAEVMPAQTDLHYHNALNIYLRKHHGLAYVEMHQPEEFLAMLRIADPGWHMLTGTTVRSASLNGSRHVVVARHGEMVWDPHPSRDGLLAEIQWAFLVPFPKRWEPTWARMPHSCECPACKALVTAP